MMPNVQRHVTKQALRRTPADNLPDVQFITLQPEKVSNGFGFCDWQRCNFILHRNLLAFLCLINRQHIYASFNRPVGRGVSTRGVHILIRPGVAVLSRKLWAFLIGLPRDIPQPGFRSNLPARHLTT